MHANSDAPRLRGRSDFRPATCGAACVAGGVAHKMTLYQKLKLAWQALSIWSEAEQEVKMGKALLFSKTFWANLIALGVTVAGLVDPKWGLPVLAVLNVILRLLTTEPITGVVTAKPAVSVPK